MGRAVGGVLGEAQIRRRGRGRYSADPGRDRSHCLSKNHSGCDCVTLGVVRDTAEDEVEEKIQSRIAAVLRQFGNRLIGIERLLRSPDEAFHVAGKEKDRRPRPARTGRRQHISKPIARQRRSAGARICVIRLKADESRRFGVQQIAAIFAHARTLAHRHKSDRPLGGPGGFMSSLCQNGQGKSSAKVGPSPASVAGHFALSRVDHRSVMAAELFVGDAAGTAAASGPLPDSGAELEGGARVVVLVFVGQVGIDEAAPVAPSCHFGQREDDDVMVRVGDKKQRRFAAASPDAAGLGAAVEQKAEAFRRGILPVSGVISAPAGVSQVQSLTPSSSFQAPVRNRLWRSTGNRLAQDRQPPHESDQIFARSS